jgi:Ca2+-binding RTX toxin-like protein
MRDHLLIGLFAIATGFGLVDVEAIPDDSETLSISVTNVVGKTIVGGNSGQTLPGTNEEDAITGGKGKDVVNGRGGNDSLSGGNGADVLNGDDGNDRMVGGNGNDTMDGGNGNDVFIFAALFGNDRILGFDANPSGGGQDFPRHFGVRNNQRDLAARVAITDVGADARHH